tara:strand:- start:237 stop:1268 length:1032 start_codon:yes stop_codon:yes gene_type:complete
LSESWFALSRADQAEALEVAAGRTGRPAHLLEKDIWVVWALSAIYGSPLAEKLTFKGGTSLSKVYKIIDRFSEDVDLTYDIRELVPDLLQGGHPIPVSASQEKKITSAVRTRLPEWIAGWVKPVLEGSLVSSNAQAEFRVDGKDREKLIIDYRAVKTGTGYAEASIQLEFGARATGEPNSRHMVHCDIAPVIEGVKFPVAAPLVMVAERTFWEKATAAHVYSLQGRLRGERYSRHWYDLAAMAKTGHAAQAAGDHQLARAVAEHKSVFFAEKDANGSKVNYHKAVTGGLQLVPAGAALAALESDYTAMLEDGLLALHQPSFAEIMEKCLAIQDEVNHKARDGQ